MIQPTPTTAAKLIDATWSSTTRRKFGIAVASFLVICSSAACSTPSSSGAALNDPSLHIEAVEVNGVGTLGLSLPGHPVTGVAVYFHGKDQRPDVTLLSPKHRALLEPLLRAGYAVVSADAEGNAFGNPRSVKDYRDLMAASQKMYHAVPDLFVAESMGALAALALLAEDKGGVVKGMVGVTPLMGIPSEYRSVDFIASAWGGTAPSSADPMTWPTSSMQGRTMRLYEADADDVIPQGATSSDFAERFGSVGRIDVVTCAGGHVDPDCYDGNGVADWASALS